MMNQRRVEVLVFEGCPNVDATIERARAAVVDTRVTANVQVVWIEGDEEAKRLRFLGSPTVRVDGVDVDPGATDRENFGIQCRVYAVGGRFEGAPPADWISAALRGDVPRGATSVGAGGGCCSSDRRDKA